MNWKPEKIHKLYIKTPENLDALAKIIGDDPWEQLPNNPLAPAKYKSVGREWKL